MRTFLLSQSDRQAKKYRVVELTPPFKAIYFGAKPYEDYTQHKNEDRKKSYTSRHATREDWTKSGMDTAGFWSKHLLWNLPSLDDSISDTARRFKIRIVKDF